MLSCPTCGADSKLEEVVLEDPGLTVEACRRCEGLWIPAGSYNRWLEQRAAMPDRTEAPTHFVHLEMKDGPFLRRCPTCQYILGRYRVGTDVPFTIDRCHNCGGIWLDAQEWDALKAARLHERLHAIFTTEWQQDIRRREANEKEEAWRRRVLGDDGYDRLVSFEAWARSHPNRHVIFEILAESLGIGRST